MERPNREEPCEIGGNGSEGRMDRQTTYAIIAYYHLVSNSFFAFYRIVFDRDRSNTREKQIPRPDFFTGEVRLVKAESKYRALRR